MYIHGAVQVCFVGDIFPQVEILEEIVEPKGVCVCACVFRVEVVGMCGYLCFYLGDELVVFGMVVRQLQGDVQQRLVFRAQV